METGALAGQRIRAARMAKELSQKKLAKLLETSQQQYSRYELGLQKIPMHHIITLARCYNLSADYLLGLIDCARPLREDDHG